MITPKKKHRSWSRRAFTTKMRDHIWQPDEIFVFGSNLKGLHGAGAALFAHKHCGAVLGVGEGLAGQSYALPTCSVPSWPLSLERVQTAVWTFLNVVDDHQDKKFFLTAVGTGFAGFTHEQIATMFDLTPLNVRIPPEWDAYLAERGLYYRVRPLTKSVS